MFEADFFRFIEGFGGIAGYVLRLSFESLNKKLKVLSRYFKSVDDAAVLTGRNT